MPRSFRIGHLGSLSSLPLVHAFSAGYFSDSGLQLKLVRGIGLRSLIEDCMNGRLDAACLPAVTPVLNSQQSHETADPWGILAVLTRGGFDFVLNPRIAERLKTPRYATAEVLRIGVPPTPSSAARLVKQWHAALGSSNQPEPRCVPVPPGQMNSFLAEDVVDGLCAPVPFADEALRQGIGKRVATSAELSPHHINAVLACPPSSALRPLTVRRVLQRALARAVEDCLRELPAWTRDPAAAHAHLDPILVTSLADAKRAESLRQLIEPAGTSPDCITAEDRRFIEESCFACPDAVLHPRLLRKLVERICDFAGIDVASTN